MTAMDPQRLSRRIVLLACLAAVTALVAQAKVPARPSAGANTAALAQPGAAPPRIEVVFALDTTGSMGGLIEGAKQKIWSVASAMADGTPVPEIRIGLVAYRDRDDEYVTQRVDLTDDIDQVYERLQGFRAAGGGDGPEAVNQALAEAVDAMQWSPGQHAYKVLFLVGDAPPHMDYANDPKYGEIVARARAKGIVVNTIQCGAQADTRAVWQEIASLGDGRFVSIEQDGAMVALETPVDDELARLNDELAATVLAYGDAADRAEIDRKLAAAQAAAPAVTASRLGFLSKSGGRVNSGRRDLVDAVKAGVADVAELPASALPSEMAAMGPSDRRAYVQDKIEARAEIQSRIDALSLERDGYLRSESDRLAASGAGEGFDQQVLGAVRAQAAAKGIHYE